MKAAILLLFTLTSILCQGQDFKYDYCMNCSYADKAVLDISEISQNEFLAARQAYKSKFETDSSGLHFKDSIIGFSTAKQNYNFKSKYGIDYNQRGVSWYEYKGWIPSLNALIFDVYTISEFTLGTSLLIDLKTDQKIEIMSHFDGPNAPPSISPNNKYLISFSNPYSSDKYCRASIVELSEKDGKLHYEDFHFFESEEWAIQEVVWVSDSSFLMRNNTPVYNPAAGWIDNISYGKVIISKK